MSSCLLLGTQRGPASRWLLLLLRLLRLLPLLLLLLRLLPPPLPPGLPPRRAQQRSSRGPFFPPHKNSFAA
jgi:hypothetical protein